MDLDRPNIEEYLADSAIDSNKTLHLYPLLFSVCPQIFLRETNELRRISIFFLALMFLDRGRSSDLLNIAPALSEAAGAIVDVLSLSLYLLLYSQLICLCSINCVRAILVF